MMTILENQALFNIWLFPCLLELPHGERGASWSTEECLIAALSDVFTLSLVSWILDNLLCFVLFMSLLII